MSIASSPTFPLNIDIAPAVDDEAFISCPFPGIPGEGSGAADEVDPKFKTAVNFLTMINVGDSYPSPACPASMSNVLQGACIVTTLVAIMGSA